VPLWAKHITPQRPRLLRDLEALMSKGHLDRGGVDLPPLAGVLRKRGMRLEDFFRALPDHFRIYGPRVVYWPLADDEDIRDQRAKHKEEPYTREGWREVGVTSHMLIGLAMRLERPVHVIHNDHKIFSFAQNDDSASAIVYNVWGDHAFFYRPQMSMPASKLVVRPIVEIHRRALAVRREDCPSRATFDQQRFFDIDEVEQFLAGNLLEAGTWWTNDLKTAARLVSERHLSFYPRYISAHKYNSFTMRNRHTKKRATVYQIPDDYQDLNNFCRQFSQLTGYELPYHGESVSAVGCEAVHALCVHKRVHCDRQAIAEAQGWKCGGCEEPLLPDFEVHHILAISLGGSNDPSNLKALCSDCHAVETEQQALSGAQYAGYASQLSPRMAEMFYRHPSRSSGVEAPAAPRTSIFWTSSGAAATASCTPGRSPSSGRPTSSCRWSRR
jgi:5-methylcytosine-specific restriction endonuclease McrA